MTMNNHYTIIAALVMVLSSCNKSFPDWITNNNHSLSPDGQVAIYSSRIGDNISVSTWVNSTMGSGGAGVFDIKTSDPEGVDLIWVSDSTAQIVYPENSNINRQEDSLFFAGRMIKLLYQTKR